MYISKIFLKEIEKNYIGCEKFSKIENWKYFKTINNQNFI
jgi:hypothetical protein